MAIQVRRGDLYPLVDLPENGLVAEPGMVRVEQALDVLDHVKSSRSRMGGRVILQKRRKSSNVVHTSAVSRNLSAGTGVAHLSPNPSHLRVNDLRAYRGPRGLMAAD